MVNIENCRVSVTINDNVYGDGTHGGFVAVNNESATLKITGCVFDGEILNVYSGIVPQMLQAQQLTLAEVLWTGVGRLLK